MSNRVSQTLFPADLVRYWVLAGESITPAVQQTIDTLVKRLADHSAQTGEHVERVADYMEKFARHIGLPEPAVLALKQAVRLHDMGKLDFDSKLIDSDAAFTEQERRDFKEHTQHGHTEIMHQGDLPEKFMTLATQMAIGHHENYDGSGYPDNLSDTDIPVSARMLAIVDRFEAIANDRSYKTGIGEQQTLSNMMSSHHQFKPGQLDPALVVIFSGMFKFEHEPAPATAPKAAPPKKMPKPA